MPPENQVTPPPMKPARLDHPGDVLRPLVILAALACATGFWGYLAAWPYLH